jgi:hypothetical protein
LTFFKLLLKKNELFCAMIMGLAKINVEKFKNSNIQ